MFTIEPVTDQKILKLQKEIKNLENKRKSLSRKMESLNSSIGMHRSKILSLSIPNPITPEFCYKYAVLSDYYPGLHTTLTGWFNKNYLGRGLAWFGSLGNPFFSISLRSGSKLRKQLGLLEFAPFLQKRKTGIAHIDQYNYNVEISVLGIGNDTDTFQVLYNEDDKLFRLIKNRNSARSIFETSSALKLLEFIYVNLPSSPL